MVRRTVTVGFLLVGCATAAQAQSTQPQVSADVAKPPAVVAKDLRFPIRMMERNLEVAIERAVENIAEQVKEVDANLSIFVGTSKVRGTFFEGYGIVFYLEIPSIRPGLIDAYRAILTSPSPARQVGVGPEVAPPPPAGLGSAIAAAMAKAPVFQDSVAVYRAAVQDSLKDALIDAMVVPLKSTDTLTLWAVRDDASTPSQAMIMSVRGADIEAFRANKIDRDEMKKRITVRDF
jgi:hypothetical protein